MPFVGKLHPPVEDIGHLYDEDALIMQKITQSAEVSHREFEVFENVKKGYKAEGARPFRKLRERAVCDVQSKG